MDNEDFEFCKKMLFEKVNKVINNLIKISEDYASWDLWKEVDGISKAKNISVDLFQDDLIKEFEESEDGE
jgi:hypothetical protein